jgi:hypothetical protein
MMKTRLNRRQLLVLVGIVAIAGCTLGKSTPAPARQQATESTVTLTVDGMI